LIYPATHCNTNAWCATDDVNKNLILGLILVYIKKISKRTITVLFNICCSFVSSTGYSRVYPHAAPMDQGFSIPSQFLNEPLVANVAMQYGQALVGSGKQLVDRELEKYVPISRLKYYFAVDTGYVTKKLGLLFFPFTHSVSLVTCRNESFVSWWRCFIMCMLMSVDSFHY